MDHFNQIVNTLSEKLRAKANGKTVVGLMDELNRATLDAIAIVSSLNQLFIYELKIKIIIFEKDCIWNANRCGHKRRFDFK